MWISEFLYSQQFQCSTVNNDVRAGAILGNSGAELLTVSYTVSCCFDALAPALMYYFCSCPYARIFPFLVSECILKNNTIRSYKCQFTCIEITYRKICLDFYQYFIKNCWFYFLQALISSMLLKHNQHFSYCSVNMSETVYTCRLF